MLSSVTELFRQWRVSVTGGGWRFLPKFYITPILSVPVIDLTYELKTVGVSLPLWCSKLDVKMTLPRELIVCCSVHGVGFLCSLNVALGKWFLPLQGCQFCLLKAKIKLHKKPFTPDKSCL